MKRLLTLFLAAAACFSLSCGVLAADNAAAPEDASARSKVVLTAAEAATFSVTVPSALPMALKSDGSIEVAANAKIVNNSGAPVVISAIAVNGLNDWSVLDYATDFSTLPRGSKSMSMSINSVGVVGGVIAADNDSFPPIPALDGENELAIAYAGKIAAQATAITTATGVAEVVFTVCWDCAGA